MLGNIRFQCRWDVQHLAIGGLLAWIAAGTVLPRWLQRCGLDCAAARGHALAPITGVSSSAH